MSNHWLRLWHDLPTEPKFRTIAKLTNQPISLVMAIYVHLLVEASTNVTRGVTHCNAESVTSIFDVEIDAVKSIFEAMEGRLLDGNKIKNWDKRQPVREDNSAARVALYRARRAESGSKKTLPPKNVTQCNAVKRNVTTDKDKDKEIKRAREKPVDKKIKNGNTIQNLLKDCLTELKN